MDWPESSSYHQQILAGAHQEAVARDVNLLVMVAGNPENTQTTEFANTLCYDYPKAGRLDGIILATATLAPRGGIHWILESIAPWRHLPIVSIGEDLVGIPSILISNADSFERLVEHLLTDHGFRNPAFVSGPPSARDAIQRLDVFIRSLTAHGIDYSENRVHFGQFILSDGEAAVRSFWDERKLNPDVVICANDGMAFALIHALQKRNIRVPEDVAVTGFDDQPFSPWLESPLTTVHQPIRESGVAAVAQICGMIEGVASKGGASKNTLLRTQPVIRGSCGCPVTGEPQRQAHVGEVLASMIRADNDRNIVYTLGLFGKHYKDSGSPHGNAAIENRLLSCLGIGCWYLSLWDSPELGLETLSRMHIAWENGERIHLPADGLSFPEKQILPDSFGVNYRWTNLLQILGDGPTALGTLILSYDPDMRDRYEMIRTNLSGSISSMRSRLHLERLNRSLMAAGQQLEQLSLTDELTGHYNRRGFMTHGNRQIAYCRRQKESFWIFFMDLDGLKTINDTYGHDEGDQALRGFGAVLRRAFRETDLIARLGGDEFIILFPDSDPAAASLVHERIDALIGEKNGELAVPWKLAFSMGDAFSADGDTATLDELMQEADRVLYTEKSRKKKLM